MYEIARAETPAASCRRQINTIKRRKASRLVSKTARWYAKVEQDVERYGVFLESHVRILEHETDLGVFFHRAGYDVQCLARFVVVQHTGFRKLLKKYRKWSGSDALSQRFGILLDSPYAFHRTNFDPVILDVSGLLATIRDGIDRLADESIEVQGVESTFLQPPGRPGMLRRYTHSSIPPAMAQEPDDVSGRAVFWVHYDQ